MIKDCSKRPHPCYRTFQETSLLLQGGSGAVPGASSPVTGRFRERPALEGVMGEQGRKAT